VCGLGLSGTRFASTFAEEGTGVVVIDRDPDPSEIEECRRRRIPVIAGDATDTLVLARAGVGRARFLVAVCGDDGTNAEIALTLRSQPRLTQRSTPIDCFIHVTDDRLCDLVEEATLSAQSSGLTRLEFFNVYRAGPRALLDSCHPDLSRTDGDTLPWLLVCGSGQFPFDIVREAVRRWRLDHAAGVRLRLTLVAPDAADRIKPLVANHPAFPAVCDLATVSADLSDLDCPIPSLSRDLGTPEPTSVFVCFEDDNQSFRAAIRLRKILPVHVPIVVCTMGASSSSVVALLSESDSRLLGNVSGFGLLDRVCRPELLRNGITETLAQAVHADYVRHRVEEGGDIDSTPSLRPWETLSETLRESNRDQARDIGRKLEAIGRQLTELNDWDAPAPTFTDEEVERLAIMEHERWVSERQRNGWRLGPEKDVEHKRTPYMVPWDELSEDVKELDRQPVRGIPRLLARAGFTLEPRDQA
jgi:hypothetical protein